MSNPFSRYTINHSKSIRQVFKTESFTKHLFVLVVDDEENLVGILTDGDFRRAIWRNISLDDCLTTIMNTRFFSVEQGYDQKELEHVFKTTEIRQIPVLEDKKIVNIVFAEDLKHLSEAIPRIRRDNTVVVMAGGRGTRLEPFTHVLPKPLIPVGEKPIIEHILDKFVKSGFSSFKISVNHKSKMIKAFFEESSPSYQTSFLEEEKPLGTGGALCLLKGKETAPIFVTNCDILINEDYSRILDFHTSGNFDFTIVGASHHHIIPYGVLSLQDKGSLSELKEKPGYDFLINTGVYVLHPKTLELIPENEFFNITDLVPLIKKNGGKIGVFPVSEHSWVDVGQWDEYKKTVRKIESFL